MRRSATLTSSRHLLLSVYQNLLQITPPGPELLVGRRAGYPEGFKDLKKAHAEIQSIKSKCGQSCTVVLDSGDAVERPMKERVMNHTQTASWAHFAVHGEITPLFPRGSLLLGDTDMTRWTSDEITAAGLPCARSVVLSACQSGLGTLGGEGVLGFARAFIRAGVPSCVVSMWQVNESFCLEFMNQLYTFLHSGEDLAHAMQKSILNMMKEVIKPRHTRDDPTSRWLVLDWASFSCIGYAGVKFSSTLDSPNDRADQLEQTNPNIRTVKYIHIRDDQISSRSEEREEEISGTQPSTSASHSGKHVDELKEDSDRNAVEETSDLWKLDELLTLGKECLDEGSSEDVFHETKTLLVNYMSLICEHRKQLDSRPDLHTSIGDFASRFLYVLFHLEDYEECISWFAKGISREDALKVSLEGSGSVQYNVAVSFLKRSVVNPDPQSLPTLDKFNRAFMERGRQFLEKSCRLQVEDLDSLVFPTGELITVGFRKGTGMFAHLGRVEVVPVEMFEKLLGTPHSHFTPEQVIHLLDEVLANVIGMKDHGFHVEAEAVLKMGVTFGFKIKEEEMRDRFLQSFQTELWKAQESDTYQHHKASNINEAELRKTDKNFKSSVGTEVASTSGDVDVQQEPCEEQLWKLDELLTLGKECLNEGSSEDDLQGTKTLLVNYMSLICEHRNQLDSRPELHTAIGDFASRFLYVLFHLEDYKECIDWFEKGIRREDALKALLEASGSVQYNVAVSFLKRSVVNSDLQPEVVNHYYIERGMQCLEKSCQLQVEGFDSLAFQMKNEMGIRGGLGVYVTIGKVEVVPVEMFEKLLGTPYSHFTPQQVIHLLDEVIANVIDMKEKGWLVEAEAVLKMGMSFASKIEEEGMKERFLDGVLTQL